jgi:RNA polymerase sigma-70 factor, ECF subfamily
MDSSPHDFSLPAAHLPRVFPDAEKARAPWRVRLVQGISFNRLPKPRLHSNKVELSDSVSVSTPSTPDLLARVARGDARAMEACIEAHGGLVWSIVLKRVRDRSAAEDLTQEIFTEIWKTSGRYDPSIASESGFVAMIARRRAIDWSRKQQRLPEMESLPEKADFPAPVETPGHAMDRDSLWKALESLPDETRRLFTLHFEQGLTHSEIAESTGLPLGSVKTRLRRGLLEARALLGRLGDRLNLNPGPPP